MIAKEHILDWFHGSYTIIDVDENILMALSKNKRQM